MHLFSKHVLNTYYVAGTVLSAEDAAVNMSYGSRNFKIF